MRRGRVALTTRVDAGRLVPNDMPGVWARVARSLAEAGTEQVALVGYLPETGQDLLLAFAAACPVPVVMERKQACESHDPVRHPAWCDRTRCGVIVSQAGLFGVHRGLPVQLAAQGLISNLMVTASLLQGHGPSPTSVQVRLEVARINADRGTADDTWSLSGTELLSVTDAVELAGLLNGLADQVEQDRDWYAPAHRSRRAAWRRS